MISKTNTVLVKAWKLFFLFFIACGSDGGENYVDEGVPVYVVYTGGLWKFEGGQRYWLRSVDINGNYNWEIG